jgi:hypothetical protein
MALAHTVTSHFLITNLYQNSPKLIQQQILCMHYSVKPECLLTCIFYTIKPKTPLCTEMILLAKIQI